MIDPDCMTPDELATWKEQAELVRTQFARGGTMDPCFDCLIPFSREMAAQGRCNGTPGRHETKPRVSTDPRQIARRDTIRERRRAYFAARHLARKALDRESAGGVGSAPTG